MEEGPVGLCIHGGRWTRACIEGEGADGGWRGRAAGEAMHGQRTGEVVCARRTVGCAFGHVHSRRAVGTCIANVMMEPCIHGYRLDQLRVPHSAAAAASRGNDPASDDN